MRRHHIANFVDLLRRHRTAVVAPMSGLATGLATAFASLAPPALA